MEEILNKTILLVLFFSSILERRVIFFLAIFCSEKHLCTHFFPCWAPACALLVCDCHKFCSHLGHVHIQLSMFYGAFKSSDTWVNCISSLAGTENTEFGEVWGLGLSSNERSVLTELCLVWRVEQRELKVHSKNEAIWEKTSLLSRNKGNWPVFGGSLRLGIAGFRAGSGFVLNPLVWDLGKTLCALWDVYGKQSQEETCHNFVFEVCAFELFKHVGCECSA